MSFQEFFEQAGVGMSCLSLDGLLVEVNQRFCDMLGLRRDELVARPIKDIAHPDDYGVGAPFRAEVAQGEVEAVSGEKRFIRKDGSLVWVNHVFSVARGQNGEPIHLITVVEDISERKRAEDALRASEATLRATFRQAGVGIFITSPDRRYLQVNDRYCDLLGYTREELLQMSSADVLPPEAVEATHANRAKLMREELQTAIQERQLVRKDGSPVWVKHATSVARGQNGEPIHLITVVEDISERKQAEDALRASEETLHATFRQAGVGIFITSPDRRYLQVNDKYCDMLGYTREELLKMSSVDVLPPEAVGATDANRNKLMLGELHTVIQERQLIRKDGSLIWVNHATSVARGRNGEPIHLITVAEDISERKQTEDALRASEETLRATFRQAGVGIFVTSPDRCYLQVNDKYCDMLGYTREELLKMSSTDVLPPEAAGASQANRNKLMRGELHTVSHERQLVRRDGSLVWVNHATSVARGRNGEPIHLITVAED
ncbi:MAG: PAS domain S-box protein, partial [Proteobacteria bacterium]|nr:PAS domain S-box protein [Pseudomonadota bacterium]